MDSILAKEIEDKSIVWFENSNQYLVLDNITATITQRLYRKESIDEIAKELQRKLNIPSLEAVNFVKDIESKIVKPDTSHKDEVFSKSKEFTIPTFFEYVKYYRFDTKVYRVDFSNEFELSLIHPKFAHLEIDATSIIDFTFQIFNNNENTYLTLDGKFIGDWSIKDIHYFQGKFSMKIIECLYNKLEDNWMGVFHASAIGQKENSILVLGDSGNGKSTSLSLLQAHGYKCIADDFVPIDDTKKVYSFPAGISIKKKSLDILLPLYPELKNSAEFFYERLDKTVRYLPPTNISYTNSYPCKALVFIKYNKEIEFEFNKISNLKAFENLVPDSWISPRPVNVSIFLNWFAHLPCYQLTYSNNQKMIRKIGEIFQNEL